MEATKAQIPQTRKNFPAEQFLLIWHPKGPTYDQKKTPSHPNRTNVFFTLLFKYIWKKSPKSAKLGFLDTLTMIFPKVFVVETCDLSYFNCFTVF